MRKIIQLVCFELLVGSAQATMTSWNPSDFTQQYETLLVVELVRHGARSPFKGDTKDVFGVAPGELTKNGRHELVEVGLSRRMEFVSQKKFLSQDYEPKEILVVSTDYNRTEESAKMFMKGLYPLTDYKSREPVQNWIEQDTPIQRSRLQQSLMENHENSTACLEPPVIRMPKDFDWVVLNKVKCPPIETFLHNVDYDQQALWGTLIAEFSLEKVNQYKKNLGQTDNIKDYYMMLDKKVCELRQQNPYKFIDPKMVEIQKQLTYLLANNFINNPNEEKNNISKLLGPFLQMLLHKGHDDFWNVKTDLKYVIFAMHDFQLAQILRQLGYYDNYGYQGRPLGFASSLRFELIKEMEKCQNSRSEHENVYRVRIILDNQEIRLPFCKELYCTMSEMKKNGFDQLLKSKQIDDYCFEKQEK